MRNYAMNNQGMYGQQGFSLVELMVGMIIGLFLAMGVAQVFISNNSTFRSQEGLSRVQEGGRFAMQRISSAVRLAGFFGCSGPSDKELTADAYVLASSPPSGLATITTDTPVTGQDNVAASTSISGKTLVTGSDTITLRGSGMAGVSYTGTDASPAADITINTATYPIVEGDYVLISDCSTINMVRATEDTTQSLVKHAMTSGGDDYNTQDSLTKLFGADAIVTNPFINTFFVADSGRTNYQGNSVTSLYMQDMSGAVHELVEGVSQLQVMYGVDTDEDYQSDRYMDASQITTAKNWGDVVSVRVSLLVDSVDDALQEPTDYVFMETSYTPGTGDKRLRKEFTGFYTLRNRALGEMSEL